MSWRIEDHPEGGLQISHLDKPRFTARWTTGEFPIDGVREGEFFWIDNGSSPEDMIHIYNLVWENELWPKQRPARLMRRAIGAIERYIMGMT